MADFLTMLFVMFFAGAFAGALIAGLVIACCDWRGKK